MIDPRFQRRAFSHDGTELKYRGLCVMVGKQRERGSAVPEESEGIRIARKMAEVADQRYSDLMDSTARRCVRWEWATFRRYSLEPRQFELNKATPGEPLDEEPDPPIGGTTGHAFDADGNLIAEIDQTEFRGQYYETYYEYKDDGIARYYYDYSLPHSWRSVCWMSRDRERRITRIDAVSAMGNFSSTFYEYDDNGRVARVRRQGLNAPYGEMNHLWEIEYDEQGNVSKTIWVYPDGRRKTDFERPGPDRRLSSCGPKLRSALTEAISAALHDAAPDSPIYAVALWHFEEQYQHRLPPAVTFATERDLERFRAEHPENMNYYVWHPGVWHHLCLHLDDWLEGLCHSVNEDIWQNELYDEVNALLDEMALELFAGELAVPLSDMFVIYVTDMDKDERSADVRRFATPEALAFITKRGLL